MTSQPLLLAVQVESSGLHLAESEPSEPATADVGRLVNGLAFVRAHPTLVAFIFSTIVTLLLAGPFLLRAV